MGLINSTTHTQLWQLRRLLGIQPGSQFMLKINPSLGILIDTMSNLLIQYQISYRNSNGKKI